MKKPKPRRPKKPQPVPVCPYDQKHPEFIVTNADGDGRPKFTCTSCGLWWTAGKDGKPYIDSKFAVDKRHG